MTTEQFINEIAKYVQKHAPKYNIKVCSPIIGQAVLESGRGTSELATNANNFFGLKYKEGRCPTASGVYYKVGSEQNADGSYTSSAMQWCKFDTMEDCVIGYFDFTNISRYSNLKGVSDPKTYLENIKADGYATSLKYVDNVYSVIQKYDLTKFDKKEETNMSNPVIALSAGHGLYTAGKECSKAIDPNGTKEWYLNDRIMDKVENKLKAYNCTVVRVNDTTGKVDTALATRAKASDNANADIYIAMHHNAGISGGTGGGTVVYYYSSNAARSQQALDLYNAIVKETGLVGNRSSKVLKRNFYECRVPKAPSLLVENGFMDSKVDTPIILTEEHAEKTAIGVVNFLVKHLSLTKNGTVVPTTTTSTKPSSPAQTDVYEVQKGDTLYKISKKTGVSKDTIASLNGLKFPYTLKVGQVLKLKATTSTSNTTASTSKYTHKDFVKEVQAAIGAKVDGVAGSETLSKTVTVSKKINNKHAVVKPIQKYLNSLGYDCGSADGIAGSKFDSAVKAFQKANRCTVDGEITAQKSTWKKLLNL